MKSKLVTYIFAIINPCTIWLAIFCVAFSYAPEIKDGHALWYWGYLVGIIFFGVFEADIATHYIFPSIRKRLKLSHFLIDWD